MGMEQVVSTPLNEVMELVAEIKNLPWLEATKIVERLKAEGHH
jgi:hypothetical protein